ncbi:foldase protein PrsA family protein [Streptococcus pyogenes GA19700]|nr:foldase protein PrsA family protein [Streptococcus pyogenes GA19700]
MTYKFDSGATNVPTDVVKAASSLNEGGISDVISVLDPTSYQKKFYIVKVTKKAEKKSDWQEYKKRLKAIIIAEKSKDMNFQNKVIANALDKANVKIKDKAFANILAQYANLGQKTKAASESSTTSESSKAAEENPSESEQTQTSSAEEPTETEAQTQEPAAQ